jgi:ATP-binding cassette, subfamily B, bacterial MsbA
MGSTVFAAIVSLIRLGRDHRRLLILSLLCMAVVAAATGAYAFLLGPALRYLLSGGDAGLERLLTWVPALRRLSGEQAVAIIPVMVVVVGAVKGLGYLGQFYSVGLFGQRVVVDLRRALFEKMVRLSPLQRSTQLSGDLLSRFTADVASVEQAATYTVASWLRDSLQIAVLFGVAIFASWKLSLLALAVVAVAIIPAARLTAAVMRRTRESQTALGSIAAQVQEGLGALRTLQAFNAEAAESKRFARRTALVERAVGRAAWARAGVPAVMEILAAAAIGATLAWSVHSHEVEPEELVSFLMALVLIYQPAKDLGRVSQFALAAAVALERIEAVLRLPLPDHGQGAHTLAPLADGIVFSDVGFAWGHRQALDGVSLRLPKGRVTALVGESGSGKSTLVSLLLRFEVPSRGSIEFDGVDVRDATVASVRAQFALVTQDPLLFSSSIRDNLMLARPEATDAELEAACRLASAWGFITALPQGLETPIGERGVTLSGGQKQRLCLARAVLSNAPVLILDEATSNLDPISEREVQAALEGAVVGRTAVVIAHRLTTICSAPHIIVLERGRVVEEGTHGALLAHGGRYAASWALQHQRVVPTTE